MNYTRVTPQGKTIENNDERDIDYDEWSYFHDPNTGTGIVVNHFRDQGQPELNVYVVSPDKVDNNDWHSDMVGITHTNCQYLKKGEIETAKNNIECLVCDGRYTEQRPSIEICPHCGNTDKMQTIYLMPKCPECEGHNLNSDATLCFDCSNVRAV